MSHKIQCPRCFCLETKVATDVNGHRTIECLICKVTTKVEMTRKEMDEINGEA